MDGTDGGSMYKDAGFCGLPLKQHTSYEGEYVPAGGELKIANIRYDAFFESPSGTKCCLLLEQNHALRDGKFCALGYDGRNSPVVGRNGV